MKNIHRSSQRSECQNWRIAHLPPFGPRRRLKIRPHLESCRFLVTPPSRKTRQLPGARVPLVNKTSAHASWSAIEVLVAAPHGKVGTPIVELQGHISGSMCQVE